MNITSSEKLIYNVLLDIIKIPDICEKIIELKKNIEKKEAYEYHIERWETISSLYFRSFEYNTWGQIQVYSYIFNNNEYIIECDTNMDFFYETGISYQSRCLLLELFKWSIPNEYNNEYNWIDMLKFYDELYGELSKKIIEKNKTVGINHLNK